VRQLGAFEGLLRADGLLGHGLFLRVLGLLTFDIMASQ
jgi:hypothetical protein